MLKTQIKSSPENRQSNRQNPEITGQAHQSTVLRSLQMPLENGLLQALRKPIIKKQALSKRQGPHNGLNC
ncbi:hypothetical protein OQ252_13165 [Acetobacter farinalis]|uniref:Uncharacterized protein n=1 Tax=Acetobacter farinalis TaxID=1260984 RepID=A0ABT3QAK5_9PROT|nr:hypothetical protein [Acetobacter farinalis]MCX2562328.1 hypothetical protein [Acetobacter farinalis]